MAARRRERTVFDGIEPNAALSPRTVEITPSLIRAWEENLAKFDDEIAHSMKCRAAHMRCIAAAKKKLETKGTRHEQE